MESPEGKPHWDPVLLGTHVNHGVPRASCAGNALAGHLKLYLEWAETMGSPGGCAEAWCCVAEARVVCRMSLGLAEPVWELWEISGTSSIGATLVGWMKAIAGAGQGETQG